MIWQHENVRLVQICVIKSEYCSYMINFFNENHSEIFNHAWFGFSYQKKKEKKKKDFENYS